MACGATAKRAPSPSDSTVRGHRAALENEALASSWGARGGRAFPAASRWSGGIRQQPFLDHPAGALLDSRGRCQGVKRLLPPWPPCLSNRGRCQGAKRSLPPWPPGLSNRGRCQGVKRSLPPWPPGSNNRGRCQGVKHHRGRPTRGSAPSAPDGCVARGRSLTVGCVSSQGMRPQPVTAGARARPTRGRPCYM